MKQTLRIVTLLCCAGAAITIFSGVAQAQIDLAFGLSTLNAPSASQVSSNHQPQSLDGGAYPVFTGDFLIFRRIGFEGEVTWKASQGNYAPGILNQPYRPIFWDFNAIWVPKLANRTYLELVGGIGGLSTRFYAPTTVCTGAGCYSSSNHLMGDFGGGIRFYPLHSVFIRPEARFYLINNNVEFSSAYATRFGVSIGYTFR